MAIDHAQQLSLNLQSLIQKLVDGNAQSQQELKDFAIRLYQEVEEQVKKTEPMQVLEKIDGVAVMGIPLDVIYERIMQFLYESLKSWTVLGTNKFSSIKDAVFNWDAGKLDNNERQSVGTFQGMLLGVLNRVNSEQLKQQEREEEQKQYRAILLNLHDGLQVGKAILDDKLQHLQKQKDKDPQIQILKTAIGPESPDDLKKAANLSTFTGLSAYIMEKVNSSDLITQADMGGITAKFNELKNEKIIKPIQQYDKARKFTTKVNEWARDLIRKTFGFGLLSTKATLFGVLKDEKKLFKIGNARAQSVSGEINFKPW